MFILRKGENRGDLLPHFPSPFPVSRVSMLAQEPQENSNPLIITSTTRYRKRRGFLSKWSSIRSNKVAEIYAGEWGTSERWAECKRGGEGKQQLKPSDTLENWVTTSCAQDRQAPQILVDYTTRPKSEPLFNISIYLSVIECPFGDKT